MASVTDSLQGLEALRDVLATKLADLDFSAYGGAEVVTAEEEPDSAGIPRIVLDVENDEPDGTWGHSARRCVVVATVEASDFAGAIYGVANPVTADTQLSQFLMEAVRDHNAFNDAGLWGITSTGPREGRSAQSEAPGAVNLHRITYYYDPEDA